MTGNESIICFTDIQSELDTLCLYNIVFMHLVMIVIGVVLALGTRNDFSGSYTSGYTFGADFYTEQYAATQNATNNVMRQESTN